jgi:hypothetical protein
MPAPAAADSAAEPAVIEPEPADSEPVVAPLAAVPGPKSSGETGTSRRTLVIVLVAGALILLSIAVVLAWRLIAGRTSEKQSDTSEKVAASMQPPEMKEAPMDTMKRPEAMDAMAPDMAAGDAMEPPMKESPDAGAPGSHVTYVGSAPVAYTMSATPTGRVRLRLAIEPSFAYPVVIFRGKAYWGNSFESPAVLPRKRKEVVRIKAKGFKNFEFMILLDQTIEQKITLVKSQHRMPLFELQQKWIKKRGMQ